MSSPPPNLPTGASRATYHHRNRPVHIPDGVMAVGLIVGAHGLNGEIKIEPHTDNKERFAVGNIVLLGEDLIEVGVKTSRQHKGMQLIRIQGIENRTQAEELRGQWLFIPESEAVGLEEDTYWIHDIVGLTVVDTTERVLGTVRNVMETGANDVYIIEPAEGINQGRELLLPAIADVIRAVDVEAGILRVQLMPGLLDEDSASS